MKAIVYRKYGASDILEQVELPNPRPGPREVLVAIRASSVNPYDWKIASGKFWPVLRARLPQVPGMDFAGDIVQIGSEVTGFKLGQRVHGMHLGSGASAELAAIASNILTVMPDSMDFTTAASLPMAGMTALYALQKTAAIPMKNNNQRILIIGASGGVGHLAVQIAKTAGATVIGVCSQRNKDFVQSLGAHEVFDYTAVNPYARLSPCDIILDCVGQSYRTWLRHLRPQGHFVSILPNPLLFLKSVSPFGSKKVSPCMLKATPEQLQFLDELVVAGKLKITQQSFPLHSMRQAWELSLSNRAIGKIVLTIS